VACHAELHASEVAPPDRVIDHALGVGIDLGLAGIHGQSPPAVGRFHLFGGQVGTLHDADADRRSSGLHSPHRPGGELPLHFDRIGKVRLQRQARRQLPKPGLFQYRLEKRNGQMQIPVCLHVEVDELGDPAPVRTAIRMLERGAIEGAQARAQALKGGVEGDQAQLARQGRDLDRNRFDVGTAEQLEILFEATLRLLLAEHGFPQPIEVQPNPLLAAPVEMLGQLRLARAEDHGAGAIAKPGQGGARHDRGQRGTQGAHTAQREPLAHREIARRPQRLEQVEHRGDDVLGIAAAVGPIREQIAERLAPRVVH